jgi:hypothetical protein
MRAKALMGICALVTVCLLLVTLFQMGGLPLETVAYAAMAPVWSNFQPTNWIAGPSVTCSVQAYNPDGLLALGRYRYSTNGGASWSAESEQGLSVVLDGSGTTAYLTVSSLSLPESATANQNQIQFAVWDTLGLQTWSPNYSVKVDNNPPSSVVNTSGCYSTSWPGQISGTASDSASGVASVGIRLRRNSDSWYYNGSAWQPSSVWLTAVGTTSWYYSFTPGQDSYVAQSRATDAVGRQQTTFGEGTFSYDISPPQSTVETSGYFNAGTWLGYIAGLANDSASGVASVEITLRRASDGRYYNGSTWLSVPTWLATSGTVAWAYAFTPSVDTTYTVNSRARDQCGNVQPQLGEASFTYDGTAPQSSVATSGCFSAASWPGQISGSASDGLSGVDYVQITLRRTSDGLYYNGSSWSSAPTWLTAAGTSSWSYAFAPSVNTTYTINSRAVDKAGNVQSAYGTGSFIYDSTAPGAPTSLLVTPSTWSQVNSFDLTWSNPPDVCGIAKAHYKWDTPPSSNSDESPGSPVTGPGIQSISGLMVPSEGAHRLYVWLEDVAGNVSYLNRASTAADAFKWDNTPPVTSVAGVQGSAGCDGWYTSDVEVELSAFDATSDISATLWRKDGGAWQQLSGGSFIVSGEGSHTVEYYSVDRAGNSEGVVLLTPAIKIDSQPPTTQQPNYAGSLGQNGWYVSSVSVALTAIDATSSISATYHRVGSEDWALGSVFTVITDGVHSIQYYSVDKACNQEAEQTASTELKIDKTHPITTYEIEGLQGENECFITAPVTVTLSTSDVITGVQTAGIAELHYRVHPGVWQSSTESEVTLLLSPEAGQEEATRTVEYYASDLAGNSEPLEVLPVCIDRKAPGPIRTLPSVSPSGFTNTNCFTLTWRTSDNPDDLSGIGGALHSFTQPTSPADGTLVLGDDITSIPCIEVPEGYGDGEHDVYLWLRDKAGNSDHLTYRIVKLRLDQTPPEIDASVAGNQCGTADWYNTCVTVTFTASDVHAGMAGGVISHHVNSGVWTEGATYTECRDGIHMIEGRATDAAGNTCEAISLPPIRVDQTAPSGPLGVRVDPSGWSKTDAFTITWINPGDLSGLAGLYYKQASIPVSDTDGIYADGVQSSLSVSASAEGEIPVYIWLKDRACNSSYRNRAMATLRYDSTPPTTTFSLSGVPGGDNWYISPVQVRLNGIDGGSGWAGSYYRIAGGPESSGTQFNIDAEGVITFSYYSVDTAGNIEATNTDSVRIDRVPPSAYVYADAYSPTTSFTVFWGGRDASSGIACFDVQYRVGTAGIWQDWITCAPLSQSSELFRGATPGKCYYFRARATDRAGNVGSYPSQPNASVCVDVVQNGDYEQILGSEWEQNWLPGDGSGSCAPFRDVVPSYGGGNTHAVVLGCPNQETGAPFGASMVCQRINVPRAQDWPVPMVRFRYRVFTYDVLMGPTTGLMYDSFNVGLWPPGQVQPTYVFTDGNRTTDWGTLKDLGWREGAIELSAYAGQSVKVCLANVTRQDSDLNTWTWVDDVRLVNLEHRLFLPVVVRTASSTGKAQQLQLKSAAPESDVRR